MFLNFVYGAYSDQLNYLRILFALGLVCTFHENRKHKLYVSSRAYANIMINHHFQCWFTAASHIFAASAEASAITTVTRECESIRECMSVFTFAWNTNIIPVSLLTRKEEREEAHTTCKAGRTCVMKAATQRKCHIKCS